MMLGKEMFKAQRTTHIRINMIKIPLHHTSDTKPSADKRHGVNN